jgi:hypothetical protein
VQSTIVTFTIASIGILAFIITMYVLYQLVLRAKKHLAEREDARRVESATLLAAKRPPPAGYGIGCCIAVPADPSNPTGYVKYVLVINYTVIDLSEATLWALHCDDGATYMQSSVMPVPGGLPDSARDRGDGGVNMGSNP